ncbi:hypothetical protein K1W54_04310 [Micromonospora sp. CPCC 205371]|nr:hypothetical protein [Micromonospora sp. CPCC 205371]
MSFPFETTIGGLASNLGRYEIAYVPGDHYLAAGIETVSDQRNGVEWLSVEAVEPRDGLMTVVAGGQRFGPFAVVRQIVLRRTEVQS